MLPLVFPENVPSKHAPIINTSARFDETARLEVGFRGCCGWSRECDYGVGEDVLVANSAADAVCERGDEGVDGSGWFLWV